MIVVCWLTGLLFVVLVLRDRARARADVKAGLAEAERRQWRPPGTPDPLADVNPYDLARLRLGTGHALDTAVVTLIRRGVLRTSRDGQVSAIAGQQTPAASAPQPQPEPQLTTTRLNRGQKMTLPSWDGAGS